MKCLMCDSSLIKSDYNISITLANQNFLEQVGIDTSVKAMSKYRLAEGYQNF